MTMRRTSTNRICCIAVVGIAGFLSLFSQAEQPEKVAAKFASLFLAQDAAGIMKIIHPDTRTGKQIRLSDVQAFLKRFRTDTLKLKNIVIDRRFTSEDGKTERFQATLLFTGPSLDPRYPDPSTLKMVLIWALEEREWFLERPVEMEFLVVSNSSYPTQRQEELAMRFQASASVLKSIGLPGREDIPLIGRTTQGPATAELKELESLHVKERSPKGVDPGSQGVQVLLKLAMRRPAGFKDLYRGEFVGNSPDKRRPMPWDVIRDYALGVAEYGKVLEKRGSYKTADHVYRCLISLGRQCFDEPGGFHSYLWGLTFQKYGVEGLLRILPKGSEERQHAENLLSLTSRRLDLLQTSLECLDDLADYNSLKASMLAAQGEGEAIFRPWGINSLAILGLRGAPAHRAVSQQVGGMVLVLNPAMQKKALDALESPALTSVPEVSSFVRHQVEWVRTHRVYGATQAFR